jgi:hypothetical protein
MSAPVMLRVCCVCHRTYGTTPCVPEMDGKETHGYCPEHERAALAKFERFNFDAGTAPSEHSRSAPRCEAAAASTPQAPAACVESISLSDLALITGLTVERLRLTFEVIRWRDGEQFWTERDEVRVRETALPDLVGVFSTTERSAAALKLMLWLSRSTETSCPPRRPRVPWYQQEAYA